MVGSEMQQLMEMGVPGGRAKAALLRAKNDVMAAAERVFAGEFDGISSDDEGEDEPVASGSGSKQVIKERSVSSLVGDIAVASDEDDAMEDDDEDEEMLDDGDVDDGEGFGGFEEDSDGEDRLLSDPYAGIFFSKDRTETIIENVEKPEYVQISRPVVLSEGKAKSKGKAAAGEKVKVRLLGNGEWMGGCPEGSEQSHLFQLYNKLTADPVSCSNHCGHEFQRKKKDFFALFTDFPSYLSHVASIVNPSCPKCSHITCLACGQNCDKSASGHAFGRSGTSTPVDKGKGKGKEGPGSVEMDSLLHCVDIQGAILGVGLFMIESSSSNKAVNPASSPSTPPAKRRRTIQVAAVVDQSDDDEAEVDDYADSVGYGLEGTKARGTKSAAGTGYSGNVVEDRSGQLAAQKAQSEADAKLATLLSQVQVYLPHMNRRSGARTSDHLVHPTALAHLRRRSGFVSQLLFNDSLIDMSNRGELYRALFDWLEVISSHEALASMLAMPQMRPTTSTPVPGQSDQRAVVYEGSPSPRELLESVVIQATAALRGLQSTTKKVEEEKKGLTEDELRLTVEEARRMEAERKEVETADENSVLREFCNRIITSANTIDKSLAETKGRDFVKRMKDSLPKLPERDDDAGDLAVPESGATGEAIIKIYEEWAMKTRFQYADLSEPSTKNGVSYRHAYNAQIVALEAQNAPKRSLAIAKELAILTTSLPVAWHSTIFLRVDESRVDCIKAMIIGPEGTPYENGCFIFDIFLPLEYNQKSPVVKSMTTNGGKYRYNPNLYAEGKVCLSLLGTWQGPGWIAGQSTLLQVLISIQSLIMCEEPYLNEPAWSSDSGTPQSKAYSANVRRMVLVDAMAGNIKNPPYPFENEIRTHFRLKAPSIRKQLEKWEKMDDKRGIAGDSYTEPVDPAAAAAIKAGGKGGKGTKREPTAFTKAAEVLRGLLRDLEVGKGVGVGARKAVGGSDGADEDEDGDEGEGGWDDLD